MNDIISVPKKLFSNLLNIATNSSKCDFPHHFVFNVFSECLKHVKDFNDAEIAAEKDDSQPKKEEN